MNDPTDRPPTDPLKEDANAIANHRPYHQLVRRLLHWKGVHKDDIEDAHQDVFVAIFECLPRVKPVRSMEALLAKTCFRHAATYVRRKKVRGPVMEYADDTGPSLPESQRIPAPEGANILKQRAEALNRVLARMEHELREVFVLIEIEEMDYEATMEALEIGDALLRSRLRRARKQFAELARLVRAELKR
jgi:RNA polymerase sigma-70 factor (ECF subfamily)